MSRVGFIRNTTKDERLKTNIGLAVRQVVVAGAWYNVHSIFISQVKEKAVDILLVDDNPLMQQLIARFLGDLGYQISVAGRADDAIELARGEPPRLFLIDMHLPDLDGPEALHALRELPGCADMPAIAISGMDEHDVRHALTKDFAEYLTKPIDLDVLQATVARYLGGDHVRSVG
jgi:CheY-like chemotaxis protein